MADALDRQQLLHPLLDQPLPAVAVVERDVDRAAEQRFTDDDRVRHLDAVAVGREHRGCTSPRRS